MTGDVEVAGVLKAIAERMGAWYKAKVEKDRARPVAVEKMMAVAVDKKDAQMGTELGMVLFRQSWAAP